MTDEQMKARIAELEAERDALRAERDALKVDAERYRHARAHGWPINGPQCIAWTHDGKTVLADTPESAIDAAMNQPKEGQ